MTFNNEINKNAANQKKINCNKRMIKQRPKTCSGDIC